MNLKKPSKVFMMSMGELWGEWISQSWQEMVLNAVEQASQHTFLNLTKNPDGMVDWQNNSRNYLRTFPDNMWLGVSVTGDDDESRLHTLNEVGHKYKFVSFEPLLADVVSNGWFTLEGIKWVIIGAQTGPGGHQPDPMWVSHLAIEAYEKHIPIFAKDNLEWKFMRARPRRFPEGFP